MKRAREVEEDTMRASYDFSKGIRNPFAHRFAQGSNLVMIQPELFRAFPSEKAVNDALEILVMAGAQATAVKASAGRAKKAKTAKRAAQGKQAKAS